MSMIQRTILFFFIASSSLAQPNGKFNTWSAYGGDGGGTRFSSLTQINESNVHSLKMAWTFRTGELETYKGKNENYTLAH